MNNDNTNNSIGDEIPDDFVLVEDTNMELNVDDHYSGGGALITKFNAPNGTEWVELEVTLAEFAPTKSGIPMIKIFGRITAPEKYADLPVWTNHNFSGGAKPISAKMLAQLGIDVRGRTKGDIYADLQALVGNLVYSRIRREQVTKAPDYKQVEQIEVEHNGQVILTDRLKLSATTYYRPGVGTPIPNLPMSQPPVEAAQPVAAQAAPAQPAPAQAPAQPQVPAQPQAPRGAAPAFPRPTAAAPAQAPAAPARRGPGRPAMQIQNVPAGTAQG